MALHNLLGKDGEEKAASYLQGLGYQIVHRNWHYGRKELDIVAWDGDTLVVAEVKTRSNNQYGEPLDYVTPTKIKRIVSSTDAYLRKFKMDCSVRFDILSIIPTMNGWDINHIKDAFMPPVITV